MGQCSCCRDVGVEPLGIPPSDEIHSAGIGEESDVGTTEGSGEGTSSLDRTHDINARSSSSCSST